MKTFRLAAIGLLASVAMAVPAHAAVVFDFSFTAPLGNGDTATGSGTLTTDDADSNGNYRFQSVTGSFLPYRSGSPRTISTALGIDGRFEISDGALYQDQTGAFVTDGVAFFDEFPLDGIGFFNRAGGVYGGFFSEVGVRGATVTFTQAVTAGVPEPATWAMLMIGFGAMGAAMRRRKVRVAFA